MRVKPILTLVIGSLLISCTSGVKKDSPKSEVFPDKVEPVAIESVKKKRNVVFILTDDHRYDAMGFLGHPFMKTPHLDSIAQEGVYLKNALVTTSLCSPSRASILTGLYTHKHRVIDNQRQERPGAVYFPEYLQKVGYNTAFIGKWHMGSHNDDPRKGFDRWVSFAGQGHYLPPSPDYTLNVDGDRVKQKGYITDELTDYAIDWLKQQNADEKPFMLYLSHKAVHGGFIPAERHKGMYDNQVELPTKGDNTQYDENAPRWLKDQRNSWHGVDFPYHSTVDITRYYQNYTEAFAAVDESIGRVKQQLKDMGIYDETLIIYMGDNGFMFGEHGLIDKRNAYETSMRVPMVMQCPELFEGNQVVDEVVGNIDIGPTILEAAGVETPEYMDGQSFIKLAQNKQIKWRDYFLYVYYWEKNYPQTPTIFALRGDRFKYITYYGLWDTDELYDLQADPQESNNLIHKPEYQAIAKKMESKLYEMLNDKGGMDIPMNQPKGKLYNVRYGPRNGDTAADFPENLVVDEPINFDAP